MAVLPQRVCAHAGCSAVTRGSYCPRHAAQHKRERTWASSRSSAASRGYGRDWAERRERVLARDPICRECGRRPSTEADHLVPKSAGGSDAMSNLRGLCQKCHRAKTQAEARAARRRPRRLF
jgi:5-methylcytosine-specific restriction protein A